MAAATNRELAEALALQQELGDRRREALVRHNLGQVATAAGDAPAARIYHHEARVTLMALGDTVGAAYATWGLGVAATAMDDPAAETLLRQALATFEQTEERPGVGYALQGLGRLALRHGQGETAGDYLRQALLLRRDLGDRLGVVKALEGLGEAALRSEPERAVRLLAAAAERDALGLPQSTAERTAQPPVLATLRATLGETRFATAWAIGQIQPVEQAIAEALTISSAPVPAPAAGGHEVLTAREQEVLRLLVAGHSDREIAATLFVSPKTASNHVASILAKFGVSTRTAAATRALRDGLV